MKNKKPILLTCLTLASLFLASCGGNSQEPSSTNSVDSSTKEQTSQTQATIVLTAKQENVSIKLGQSPSITNYYTIKKSSGTATAAEKACTYESSDPTIVKIVNKTMKALKVGTTKVTITSNKDKTKKCEINVTVEDVYFDRAYSNINSEDDFDKELIKDGGTVRTKSATEEYFYAKDSSSVNFIGEASFTLHSVASSEKFPKLGIICSTTDNANEDGATSNKMAFFLNAEMPKGEDSWNNFGICEVENGSNWAWNPNVANNVARHKDDIYTTENAITYEKEFKLTMVRKGVDFHFFVDGVYANSAKAITTLFKNSDTDLPSMVGFFVFNADVTISKYSFNINSEDVDAKISSIENPHFLTEEKWAED